MTISRHSDSCEQEAVRVADQIITSPSSLGLEQQIKTDIFGHTSKEETKNGAQGGGRRNPGDRSSSDPHDLIQNLGHGQPLNRSTRNFFESHFGHDFSHVRVHADEKADAAARMLNADAFTVGTHMVFAGGCYPPHAETGNHLLAHELTHVVQQEQGAYFIARKQAVQSLAVPALPTIPAGGQCLERPESLSLDRLEECVRSLYIPENRPSGFPRLARAFIQNISSEARRLPDEEVAARKRQYFLRWRTAPPASGEFAVADGYWWVYDHEDNRRMQRARHVFPPEQAARIAAPPVRMAGGMRCLEVFYYHLQELYGAETIAGSPETKQVSDSILIKNVVERLERTHRKGVPEEVLLDALASEGLKREAAVERLHAMRRMGMLGWSRPNRWQSTGEFGKGLITETGESLARRGLAGERIDFPTPGKVGDDTSRASRNLAVRLRAWISAQVEPIEAGSGDYVFALALHRDYHSVMLHVQVRAGKLQLFWADQYGKEHIPDTRTLAAKINEFWPNYWPAYSSVWPLMPRPED